MTNRPLSKTKIQQNLRNTKKKIAAENKKVDQFLAEAEKSSFRGHPLLKSAGEKHNWTKERLAEYIKCKNDPIYFCKYIKIIHVDKGLVNIIDSMTKYQEKLINTFKNERFTIALQCRQSFKCVSAETKIRLKNSSLNYNNGEPFEMTIGDFYLWQAFKEEYKWLEKYELNNA